MTRRMSRAASCVHLVAQAQVALGRRVLTTTVGSAINNKSKSKNNGGKRKVWAGRGMSTGSVGGGPFQVDDALVQHYAEMPIDR